MLARQPASSRTKPVRRALARAVESLEGRRLLAAVAWDGGGDGVSWTSANNWSTNALPGPADDVTINVAANPTINLAGANAVINSLASAESLNLNSGTLSVAAASSSAVGATLSVTGATLTGAGTFTVNGPLAFTNGRMGGGGVTRALGTATVGSGGAFTYLDNARRLSLEGTATEANANGFYTTLNNTSTLAVASGGTLATGNGSRLEGAGTLAVEASGTLTRTVAGTSSNLAVNAVVNGTVDVDLGTLALNGGGTFAGVGTPAAGATLQFGGPVTYASGASFSGGGRIALVAGTQTVADGAAANDVTVAAGTTLAVAGATVNAVGTTIANGPFEFPSGVLQGTGTTRALGTATIGGSNTYNYLRGSHQLVLAGAATTTMTNGYFLSIATDARLRVASGGTLSLGAASYILPDTSPGGAVAVDAGGALTTSVAGTSNLQIRAEVSGAVTAAAGSVTNLQAGSTIAIGSTIGGAGVVQFGGGTHTVTGLTVDTGGTLRQVAGTVDGGGALNVDGTLDFLAGIMTGAGSTVVRSGGTATIGSTSAFNYLRGNRTLRVEGVATFATDGGYYLSIATGAQLRVAGGGTLRFDSAAARVEPEGTPGGSIVIDATGTLTRTVAGNANVNVNVQNAGTVRAAAGASVTLTNTSTHQAGSQFAGPGIVRFSGGTHATIGATVAVGGTLELVGNAIIDGAGSLAVGGALNLFNGRLRGAGTTTIRVGGTMTIGGAAAFTYILDGHNVRVAGTATNVHAGGYYATLGNASRITVAAGGTLVHGADGYYQPDALTTGGIHVEAGGTFTRTFVGDAGYGVDVPVYNGGIVRAAAAGVLFSLDAGSTNAPGSTFAGAGVVQLAGGTHAFDGATVIAGATLRHASGIVAGAGTLAIDGTLNWTGGTQQGTGTTLIRNTGTATLGTGSAFIYLREGRTFRVESTATLATAGGYFLEIANAARLLVASGATLNLVDGSRTEPGAAPTSGVVVESGATLRRDVAGSALLNARFENFGTVRVNAGNITFGNSNVGAGAFLTTGRYLVAGGASVGFPGGTNVITADFELTGTASVAGLGALNVNRGRIALLDGANFATTPAGGTFTLEGIIDLSPTSTFTVNGNVAFGGTSQPVVRSEIAGATQFGRVVLAGPNRTLTLNSPLSTSRFDPDLVGGYDPAVGMRFAILTAASRLDGFDSIQGGLTPGGNVLGAYATATAYGAEVVPGPPPPAPQILSTAYEFQTRQAVTFTFDQDVSAFLSRKDYALLNRTSGQTLPQSAGTLTFNPASNGATLLLTNQLPDGDYRLTVNASDIANGAGVPASGAPIVIEFFVLAGDVNRDRAVNFADLVTLAQNYNQTGRTFGQGNVDYSADGTVGFGDLVALAQNYNKVLGPPLLPRASAGDASAWSRVTDASTTRRRDGGGFGEVII